MFLPKEIWPRLTFIMAECAERLLVSPSVLLSLRCAIRCESSIRRLPHLYAVLVSFSNKSVFVFVSVFVARALPLSFLRATCACCCGRCSCCFVGHFVAVFVVCLVSIVCFEQQNSSTPPVRPPRITAVIVHRFRVTT